MSNLSNEQIHEIMAALLIVPTSKVNGVSLDKIAKGLGELLAYREAAKSPDQYSDDKELSFCIDLYDDTDGDLRLAMWLKELRRRREIPTRFEVDLEHVGYICCEGDYLDSEEVIEAIKQAGGTVKRGEL